MTSPRPAPSAHAQSQQKTRLLACGASALLFVLACATPAMTVFNANKRDEEQMWGLALLLMGWLGVFTMQFGWFANPLLCVAFVMLLVGADRKALWVGGAASILGLTSLTWYINPIPADESGGDRYLELLYPSIGFIFWLGSLLVIPLTAHHLSQPEAESKPQASSSPEPEA
ncbi:hypothetical protein HRD49_02160 [Corallococcus exiguus]|uniref:Transmembrane protein n=1 Tax=Corallococcus exiguus TaxID=83462 RepID=A0A7X4YFI9_9BACT|nr:MULTISPECIES: hypothetical protein [Corallococcus]NBC43407.1 hypothetical protein [Corallococcus exiguus]NNC16732.1 hypothetical protein [Corallococcus exiguus]NRD53972.1 hypothetical protein [Corallococcus exiguus]NRD60542.1 hypothetical protein [Corallococcus exiguus]RKH12475.1 hypothetical protein D7V77_41140 [Corallococcus sp. CA041A]